MKKILLLLGGFLAMVLVMVALRGAMLVVENRTVLEIDADGREGRPLSDLFEPVENWATTELQEARRNASSAGAQAVVALHRGRLVAEWGATDQVSPLHDAGISILSLLYGIAAERGLLSLDQAPADSQATVGDLLQSRDAGVAALAFEQRTGLMVDRALENWLAGPLGFVDFDTAHVVVHREPNHEGPRFELAMSARDMARVGQMVLDNGRWRGVQVVPAAWIAESTQRHRKVDPAISAGYAGLGWWVPVSGEVVAWGTGGQHIALDRLLDMVIIVKVISNGNGAEHTILDWTDDDFGRRDYRRLKTKLADAGNLGRMDPRFADLVERNDVPAAIAHVHGLLAANADTFVFTEAQANALGYEFLGDGRIDDAVAVFELNVELFPAFANTHDSLGEALLEQGNFARSRACYERALELNPWSRSAPDKLVEIGVLLH